LTFFQGVYILEHSSLSPSPLISANITGGFKFEKKRKENLQGTKRKRTAKGKNGK
jgi:hypothetical protein